MILGMVDGVGMSSLIPGAFGEDGSRSPRDGRCTPWMAIVE